MSIDQSRCRVARIFPVVNGLKACGKWSVQPNIHRNEGCLIFWSYLLSHLLSYFLSCSLYLLSGRSRTRWGRLLVQVLWFLSSLVRVTVDSAQARHFLCGVWRLAFALLLGILPSCASSYGTEEPLLSTFSGVTTFFFFPIIKYERVSFRCRSAMC